MYLKANDQEKLFTIWFKRDEITHNDSIPPELVDIINQYKQDDYTISVMYSGKEDMSMLFSQIMINNL